MIKRSITYQCCLQKPRQADFAVTLPVVNSGIVRIRFLSSMSVHKYSRFTVHYSTLPPGFRPCDGLLVTPDEKSWYHVAVTVDQINASAVSTKIYVNGTVRADAVASSDKLLYKPLAFVGEMGLAIGRSDPGRPSPSVGPFHLSDYSKPYELHQGAESFWAAGLDELRLWNVSRSAEEIFSGLSTTCKAGTFGSVLPVLCYSFDRLALHMEDGNMYFTDLGLAPPVVAQAVVGDRFAPWCNTLGDGGVLVDKVCCSSHCNGLFPSFCSFRIFADRIQVFDCGRIGKQVFKTI
jgi:hypothetical protein